MAGTHLISIDKADGNTDPWRYLLGITEDNTLPLNHGYLHRIRRGVSLVFAIIRSVEAPGRAVVAISIVLIAQFGLLGLSDFRPTAHFGMLCAVGLFAGQLFELLLMPALLGLRLHRPKAVKASSA